MTAPAGQRARPSDRGTTDVGGGRLTSVQMKVRAASLEHRSGRRSGLLIPLAGLVLLLVTVPFGGLSAVVTTVPAVLLLIGFYLPIVASMARREVDPKLARVIWLGFVAKLVGFTARFLVVKGAYGASDSRGYDLTGTTLARSYQQGEFFVGVPGAARGQGTLTLRVITGLIYTMTGPGLLVGSIVFALLSFTGLVLCVKAFRLAVPEGDHARYARLVLLVPSMFFWPSSLGKDAWMLLGLGVLSYGAARLYTRHPGGLVLVALGTILSALIRPHIALVAFGAVIVGLLLRRAGSGRRKRANLLGKLVLLVPLGFASLLLISKAQTFLSVEDLSLEGVQAAGEQAGGRTQQGGSEYKPTPVNSPADLPWAAVTVLFRPFPIEAGNAQSFGIAVEGTALLLFTVMAWRRILAGLRALPRSPFLVLSGVYSLAFIAAFSNIANFGILARERVQVYPFFFAFLAAVPAPAIRRALAKAADGKDHSPRPARAGQPA